MKGFLDEAANQNHPLRTLKEFLNKEEALKEAKLHDQRRFVGYVLKIGYGEITIITSDPFKVNVGGIPRNLCRVGGAISRIDSCWGTCNSSIQPTSC